MSRKTRDIAIVEAENKDNFLESLKWYLDNGYELYGDMKIIQGDGAYCSMASLTNEWKIKPKYVQMMVIWE